MNVTRVDAVNDAWDQIGDLAAYVLDIILA